MILQAHSLFNSFINATITCFIPFDGISYAHFLGSLEKYIHMVAVGMVFEQISTMFACLFHCNQNFDRPIFFPIFVLFLRGCYDLRGYDLRGYDLMTLGAKWKCVKLESDK